MSGELAVEPYPRTMALFVAVRRPWTDFPDPSCIRLRRDCIADMSERIKHPHRAMFHPVFIARYDRACLSSAAGLSLLRDNMARSCADFCRSHSSVGSSVRW